MSEYLKVIEDVLKENKHYYFWTVEYVSGSGPYPSSVCTPSIDEVRDYVFPTREAALNHIKKVYASDYLIDDHNISIKVHKPYIGFSATYWIKQKSIKLHVE